ncbi:cytochrome c oxidase polypeptide 4 [Actinorhabdospora filicis]|uniref:Cytochrome c oxidase polypeptide 4 n=1 Tax=Actinorhabdospora filicis TaxID=1785913 RepID=A0A9W6WBY0_9ACTN|nr:cytochrome c oxidase subunit 4 [Actinorhabdospora filicis]GLZ80031.1 cytochrome c oxidase polypeptide 4 [Actinorhabdospora filicis]
MKTEAKIFHVIWLTLVAFVVGYIVWSKHENGHIEWVGTVALVLSACLIAMCGFYFSFVARRIDARPEDREDGEIADAAGEVGFFSPGSYWPFGIALTASIAGIGVVFWYPWLIAVGLISVLVTVGGLLFEYYTGTRRLGPE